MDISQKILLVVLISIGIFFATFRLVESPPVWFDEGWYYQTSSNLATVGIDGLQFSPGNIQHISTFVTVGYPLIYPMAVWLNIFGTDIFTARCLMVLFLLIFVSGGYFLSRQLFGAKIAIGTLALLVTFPPLFSNGKSILGEVPGLLYMTVFLVCLHFSEVRNEKKTFWLIVAMLFAGIAIATKPLFIVLLPVMAAVAFHKWWKGTYSVRQIALGLAFLIIPILVWVVVQFRSYDSILEILTFYANPYSRNDIVSTVLHNIKLLFSDVSTLYTSFLLIVWTVSVYIRYRARETISAAELIAYGFSVLIVLAFLRTAGLYRYLFPAQAMSLIFFPNSMLRLSSVLQAVASISARKFVIVMVIIMSLLGIYQLAFDSWMAESYSSRKTAFWKSYFNEEILPSDSVFFYNVPEVVPFMVGRDYYQYIKLFDRDLGSEQLDVLSAGIPDKVIVVSSMYSVEKENLFNRYELEREAYKYSILTSRKP